MLLSLQGSDIGTLVYSVSATDADEGSNGEINFSLSDPGLPFDISPSGGAIFVAGSLDYEARNEYTVRISMLHNVCDNVREIVNNGFCNLEVHFVVVIIQFNARLA